VFSLTILISSFLLFLVQPMVGRMLLPSLGGTPSVWNTCVVFFQAVLLLGYGYAHLAAQRLTDRQYVVIHLTLLASVCLVLPIGLLQDWAVPTETNPLGWLLGQLVLCVGLPFFVISANAPLLQRWYGRVTADHQDPYFLYATSNVGSLGALLVYPLLIEPAMGITAQTYLWLFGFLALSGMFVCCGVLVLRAQTLADAGMACAGRASLPRPNSDGYQGLSWPTRLRYIALAAIPSSLMLGVTTYITTDVGSFPLMWIIPLAAYLLTFILVFAERKLLPHAMVVRAVPFLLLLMPVVTLMDMGVSPLLMIAVHIVTFFFVAMLCHGEMSRLRPPAKQLTEFYLMMSIGGVVGGAFNALVAPVIFRDVIEYPLMLVAACLVMPRLQLTEATSADEGRLELRDLMWPLGLALLVVLTYGGLEWLGVENRSVMGVVVFGVPALVCFATLEKPLRFAMCYGVLTIACATLLLERETLVKSRGFFGVNEVADDTKFGFRTLINGRTMHGIQRYDEVESPEPLSYFHRLGPMGDVFQIHELPRGARVGVVGLGIGSIASYAEAGQQFDFYEIDPVVYELANDPRYFTFLASCKAEHRVLLGDARIQLAAADNFRVAPSDADSVGESPTPLSRYDLLILDAFSSDSIPTHLLTKEAF
ncbi:MAG: hypothetical protein KDD84_20415, partial [Caldilineaceae bacterium]|nr:hypothetical protein [Caldilineaceae bacterium]